MSREKPSNWPGGLNRRWARKGLVLRRQRAWNEREWVLRFYRTNHRPTAGRRGKGNTNFQVSLVFRIAVLESKIPDTLRPRTDPFPSFMQLAWQILGGVGANEGRPDSQTPVWQGVGPGVFKREARPVLRQTFFLPSEQDGFPEGRLFWGTTEWVPPKQVDLTIPLRGFV